MDHYEGLLGGLMLVSFFFDHPNKKKMKDGVKQGIFVGFLLGSLAMVATGLGTSIPGLWIAGAVLLCLTVAIGIYVFFRRKREQNGGRISDVPGGQREDNIYRLIDNHYVNILKEAGVEASGWTSTRYHNDEGALLEFQYKTIYIGILEPELPYYDAEPILKREVDFQGYQLMVHVFQTVHQLIRSKYNEILTLASIDIDSKINKINSLIGGGVEYIYENGSKIEMYCSRRNGEDQTVLLHKNDIKEARRARIGNDVFLVLHFPPTAVTKEAHKESPEERVRRILHQRIRKYRDEILDKFIEDSVGAMVELNDDIGANGILYKYKSRGTWGEKYIAIFCKRYDNRRLGVKIPELVVPSEYENKEKRTFQIDGNEFVAIRIGDDSDFVGSESSSSGGSTPINAYGSQGSSSGSYGEWEASLSE